MGVKVWRKIIWKMGVNFGEKYSWKMGVNVCGTSVLESGRESLENKSFAIWS
jgi:hypothetical protein